MTDVMCAGLSGGTASSSVFVAKFVVGPSRCSDWSCSGYFGLAAANTSAGSPCSICAASSSDPRNSNRTVHPGCSCWNVDCSVVKAFVSDDAANTVSVPPDDPPPEPALPLVPEPLPQPAASATA